jgi:hypothetical protein
MVVWSALVQEAVSRAISSVLGRLEEKDSQRHIRERLQMAANELELALERSAKLPITDVSLLQRRKMIKCAYLEAAQLLDKHEQEALVPAGQEGKVLGTKRKHWIISGVMSQATSSLCGLKMEDVRRFERFADCAGKFVRDVESGCSLRHYTFCNPLVRHLLDGKTLRYRSMEQGNRLRCFYIWPMSSEERGVEAQLGYLYKDATMLEKSFHVGMIIRLSENTDIAGVAIKCLQLLTSQFKIDAESAVGELTLLANIQDVSHSYELPWARIQEDHMKQSASHRPDPGCCKASRHGLCAVNSVSSSEATHIFPEQVIVFHFHCYISDVEYSLSSSPHEDGPSVSRGRRGAPLEVSVGILPHNNDLVDGCFALEAIGNNQPKLAVSVQPVGESVRSRAINCFLHQPELTNYKMHWYSTHGSAWFDVEKQSSGSEGAGAPKTRRYHTRASTKKRRYHTRASNWSYCALHCNRCFEGSIDVSVFVKISIVIRRL